MNEQEVKKKEKLIEIIPGKGITIINEGLMNELKKKKLSASMVGSFLTCPADWLMDTFILRKIEHEEPIHLSRGTLFHSVMEKFFAIDKGKRTTQELSKICNEIFKSEEYSYLDTDLETKKWLFDAVKKYLHMGFDYNNEEIAIIKNNRKQVKGLECFVGGRIGNVTRDIVGFVDKVVTDDNGQSIIVEDWKTGKKIHPFDPDKEISQNNSFDYWRQQTLYAMLLEQSGNKIKSARLIFPVAEGVVNVDCNNPKIREQVIKDMELVDSQLTKCIENNLFPFQAGIFCSWCGALNPNHRGRKQPLQVNKNQLYELIQYSE